jgi:hypothetical protein
MAGFPKKENTFEIGHHLKQLAGPVSLSSSINPQPVPGRKTMRLINRLPVNWKTE